MASGMRVAYLVNRYPAVSHSFIRREIHALEALGGTVSRFSIRTPEPVFPDPADEAERSRTAVLLGGNWGKILLSVFSVISRRPLKVLGALLLAVDGAGWSPKEIIRRLAYLIEAAILLRHFDDSPVDHVHAHFGTNPAFVARLTYRMGGPPFSFTAHGPDEFDRPAELMLGDKISDAKFVVGISEFGRSQLMRWSDPMHWRSIKVVRCGLDSNFINEKISLVKRSTQFCCVARLSSQKGLPILIGAAELLKQKGVDFNIVVVGDGEMRHRLQNEINKARLSENIALVGWASGEQVRDYLINSRTLVLPSFAEGLPVVIMESFALGRPVIATRIAGIPELVDERSGWIIDPGSVEDLARAMELALKAPDSRINELGAEGRLRVTDLHNARRNAELLLSFIKAPER
jgi:glycosyltransferase involved in cell wall biosynthesis